MVSVKNDYSLLSHIGIKKGVYVLEWNPFNPHPALLIWTNLFYVPYSVRCHVYLLHLLHPFYFFIPIIGQELDTCKTCDFLKVQVDAEGDEDKAVTS